MYWAEALAAQTSYMLSCIYSYYKKELEENEAKINVELIATQGKPQDIGGYY
jgi:isocitrate dehydrogenase